MKLSGLILAILAIVCSQTNAGTIGIAIPLSGDYAQLGRSFQTGAELALSELDSHHELVFYDDGCDQDFALLAAEDMKAANHDMIAGFLCNDTAITTANLFAETSMPILVSGARSIRLIKDREREAWNLWRMAPGDDYPVKTAHKAITNFWKTTPYAIVDDGTIYARNFTDGLRILVDEANLNPQFSDTFRAVQSTQAGLLRRLQRSGVNAAFIASATQEDLQTIIRDIKKFEVELDVITTEALGSLPLLEELEQYQTSVKVISAPEPKDRHLEELLEKKGIGSNPAIYLGYATVQVVVQALGDTQNKTTLRLAASEFETVLGKFRFQLDGSSSYNPYELFQWNGTALELVNTNEKLGINRDE